MKYLIALMICLHVSTCFSVEFSNEKAIKQVVDNWTNGWNSLDANLAVNGLAKDVDWINSFGLKKKGSEEVLKFLEWVFAYPPKKEIKHIELIKLLKFVRPRVVIAFTDFTSEIKDSYTSEISIDKQGNIIRVLVKENDKWEVVYMFVSTNSGPFRN